MINVFYIIDTINKYYFEKKDSKKINAIFVFSKYTATQLAYRVNFVNICRTKLNLFGHNGTELIKSCLRVRTPVFRQMCVLNLLYDGLARIDFSSGTVVVVSSSFVDKFYFKDITYFRFLYTNISTLLSATFKEFSNFLVITQPRYQILRANYSELDMLIYAEKMILTLSDSLSTCTKMNEYFSVAYKINQLFMWYLGNTNGIDSYLDICKSLEERTNLSAKRLCHGDLWKENLLEDDTGNLMVIDFDKMVYFSAPYDLVYFYLMNQVLPNVDLLIILANIDKYTNKFMTFLSLESNIKIASNQFCEFKYCIFLFVFIKLVERDLYENNCGNHVYLLKKSILTL